MVQKNRKYGAYLKSEKFSFNNKINYLIDNLNAKRVGVWAL